MTITVIQADYHNPQHARHVIELLDCYATDPMGGGEALSDFTAQNLISELADRSNALSILAYVDGQPAGLMNCFEGFSTFACQPLLNIHDVVVAGEYRRLGISRQLFDFAEKVARERDCCKLTLEVVTGNTTAQTAYENFGFKPYELDAHNGTAMFWHKPL
jgi:GNAT superfamily N-acetyltransferase